MVAPQLYGWTASHAVYLPQLDMRVDEVWQNYTLQTKHTAQGETPGRTNAIGRRHVLREVAGIKSPNTNHVHAVRIVHFKEVTLDPPSYSY